VAAVVAAAAQVLSVAAAAVPVARPQPSCDSPPRQRPELRSKQ
jgi:hypothetical protein